MSHSEYGAADGWARLEWRETVDDVGRRGVADNTDTGRGATDVESVSNCREEALYVRPLRVIDTGRVIDQEHQVQRLVTLWHSDTSARLLVDLQPMQRCVEVRFKNLGFSSHGSKKKRTKHGKKT